MPNPRLLGALNHRDDATTVERDKNATLTN